VVIQETCEWYFEWSDDEDMLAFYKIQAVDIPETPGDRAAQGALDALNTRAEWQSEELDWVAEQLASEGYHVIPAEQHPDYQEAV